MVFEYLKKPEFYFQPRSILRRLLGKGNGLVKRNTPWGGIIEVERNETIGKEIYKTGVYDLALSEMLWRLIEPGNFVLDVGANIGYTTTLSSWRAGANGKVWSFEPNSLLFTKLEKNLGLAKYKNISFFPVALSETDGIGYLQFPDFYSNNEGVAFIADGENNGTKAIELRRMDGLLTNNEIVDVLKIDVEGHELEVLKGAEKSLKKKAISHIIFEDFSGYPSPAAELLIYYGYKICRIEKGWFNVRLKNPFSVSSISKWEPTNYLATINPSFVNNKMKGMFYKCLLNIN